MKSAFQSTHPVRGATPDPNESNIHVEFQSTHPVRGATGIKAALASGLTPISIHAPREGCDGQGGRDLDQHHDFNPRTP